MKYGNLTLGQIEAGVNKIGGEEAFLRLLRDELIVSEVPAKAKPAPTPEPEVVVDPIIRVDHSVPPLYPDWVKKVLHPELEKIGRSEYDVSKVDQWLHQKQKDGGYIVGTDLYEYLNSNNILEGCLGLRDLEEIQKKGIKFFRKHFKKKAVFGWKSVVQNDVGHLYAPCLGGRDGEVVLRWRWLGDDWDDDYPALRFES